MYSYACSVHLHMSTLVIVPMCFSTMTTYIYCTLKHVDTGMTEYMYVQIEQEIQVYIELTH